MAYPNPELKLAHQCWKQNPSLTQYQEERRGIVRIFRNKDGTPIEMPVEWFFGQSAAFLGMTGSGKTQTVKRYCYELYTSTGVNMTFFDPDADYWVFTDIFPNWKVFGREHALKPTEARYIAQRTIKTNTPSVIVLQETDKSDWLPFVIEYLKTEWQLCENLRTQGVMMPHMNILEEAQVFIPDKLPDESRERAMFWEMRKLIADKYSSRGRKRGPTLAIVSQRAQKLNPDSVTQVGVRFLHYVNSPLDIDRYGRWLGQPFRQIKYIVDQLTKGMCILDGEFNQDGSIHTHWVRKLTQLRDVSRNAKPEDVYNLEEYLKEGALYGESSSIPQQTNNPKA